MKNTIVKQKKSIPIAGIIVLAYLFPLIFRNNTYWLLLGCYCCIYALTTTGLDVAFGYSGQISMGHAAYFCIGAYGSACFSHYFGVPIFFSLLIGAALSTIIGALIAYPSTKLVYHFLSLSTIAFAAIVQQFTRASPGKFTGNSVGLRVSELQIFGVSLKSYEQFYLYALTVLILALLAKKNLIGSRIGRAFIAIRENAHAANGTGVNVRLYKVIAFATSAFLAGYAGGLYAHLTRYITPDQYKQKLSVYFLTMLMFGGTGNIAGPILGVVCIQLLMESLRFAEEYQMLIYGVLLVFVVILFPGGLHKFLKEKSMKFINWLTKRKGGTTLSAEEEKSNAPN